jgi:hypothetical protein
MTSSTLGSAGAGVRPAAIVLSAVASGSNVLPGSIVSPGNVFAAGTTGSIESPGNVFAAGAPEAIVSPSSLAFHLSEAPRMRSPGVSRMASPPSSTMLQRLRLFD